MSTEQLTIAPTEVDRDPIQSFKDMMERIKSMSNGEMSAQIGSIAELFQKFLGIPIVVSYIKDNYKLPPIAQLDASIKPQEIVSELYEQITTAESEAQQLHR